MRRLLALLPPGTLKVGIGLGILGGASYVYLAIAGHVLSRDGYSSLSVLWAIVFSVGLGLFFPVEQEVTRLVAARRVTGGRFAPVYRRGAVLALAVLAGTGVLLVAGMSWMARVFFYGDRAMVLMLIGGLAGLAVAHPVRGVLAGTGRFGPYSAQLGADGILRIVFAAALGLAGVRSPALFALVLMVAPLLAVLITLGPARQMIGSAAGTVPGGLTVLPAPGRAAPVAGPGDANGRAGAGSGRTGQPAGPRDGLPWRLFLAGMLPLTVSTLLAQLMVNLPVIDVKLLAPTATALAGALLSALVLARIPLFIFGSMQASLLPGLSAAATNGERTDFRKLVRRACVIVTLLAVAGGIPTVVLGPWLIRYVFGVESEVLGDWDFALMALATGAYLLAQVLGQGVLALNRHRAQASAWLLGTLALVAVTLVPGDPKIRVEAAFVVGAAVTAAVLAVMVRRPPRISGGLAEPDPHRAAIAHAEGAETTALAGFGGAD